MATDYIKQDEELDDELRAMYAEESEPESDSPDEGTESEEYEPPEQELDTSTPESDEQTPEDTEPMVEESRYKNAVVAMNKAQQEAAELRKQIAGVDDLKSQLQQLQTQLQEQQANTTAKEEPPSTPVDDDDLSEAREIYPEVINPLLKIISNLESKLDEKFKGLESEVGSVKGVADRYQETEQKTAAQAYWDTIKQTHSDVDEIADSPEYVEWYQNQAPMIQKALSEGTANDAISALNLFRMDHPKEAQEPVRQTNKPDKLAAARKAAVPNVKGQQKPEAKPTFTNAQIAKMSREEFMKNEAAIDEAMARGEIV